ncbi:unnamed protein product [Phytomonas sp. EM1]|nr:unnamed protein product [Phytomonas sp. EM1]|eukprot:CCW60573.1 unnamed protein product [Phytomonas sp. isolate EM1]
MRRAWWCSARCAINERLTRSMATIPLGPSSTEKGEIQERAAPYDYMKLGFPKDLDSQAHQAAREAIISEIILRDKEVFNLKRQHELSMLRVEQNQRRVLKDQEDRGLYYEQNCNVHTFETVSGGLHSQRNTLYHTMSVERLRNFKMMLIVLGTIITCVYLYFRYIVNPEWEYVEKPVRVLGSRVQTVREIRWNRMTDEEKILELERRRFSTRATEEK